VLAADSEVKDSFIGDRKTARLAFVSADEGTTLADKEMAMLVFTARDHSKEERPDMMVSFGDFGSVVVITIYPGTGKLVGCDVVDVKKPFNSLGSLEMSDFKNEGGQLSGEIATGDKVEAFKKAWEFDLTFGTKLP